MMNGKSFFRKSLTWGFTQNDSILGVDAAGKIYFLHFNLKSIFPAASSLESLSFRDRHDFLSVTGEESINL